MPKKRRNTTNNKHILKHIIKKLQICEKILDVNDVSKNTSASLSVFVECTNIK